jgi:diguanylate cyclase (GGDEF)-like protein
MVDPRSASQRFTLYGILFGCCFPVGSLLFLIALDAVPVGGPLETVVAAHQDQILLYVIDTAPFFLGLFAYFAGVREDRLVGFNERLEEEVQSKTEDLRQALQEANEANEMISHMADHDALCELLNRRCFTKVLANWLRYSHRYERPGALLFIDLDGFKEINDAYGHGVGDAYLCGVADRLRETVRETDTVARWGGDEFVVLLPEADREGAVRVADKLLGQFGSEPVEVEGRHFEIRSSIGITLYPDLGTDAEQLLAQGDAAMYEAKEAGGNRWHLCGSKGKQAPVRTDGHQWKTRLRRALETDDFLLVYQPIWHLKRQATVQYEALVRLEERTGELVRPELFLEVAEHHNLSLPLDRMVITKALRKACSLQGMEDAPRISLNLAASTLANEDVVALLRDEAEAMGVGLDRLGLELPEAFVHGNRQRARELAQSLGEEGIQVVLDDFGRDLPSTRLLEEVPVDMVKLRSPLVRAMGHSEVQRDVAHGLVQAARGAGVGVTAKFVEDLDQLPLLEELGIHCAQGFAVGRPMESLQHMVQAC